MSEMQERVTNAIIGAFEHIPDKEYRRTIAGCWARAAIEAMREPTPIMLRKADDTFEDRNYDRRDDLRDAYKAMIDVVLSHPLTHEEASRPVTDRDRADSKTVAR